MILALLVSMVKTFKRSRHDDHEDVLDDRPDLPQRAPVRSAVGQWMDFLQSKPMSKILNSKKPSQLPHTREFWQSNCRDVCVLWIHLEESDKLDDDVVERSAFTTLCLLTKAAYYFEIFSPQKARKLLFAGNLSEHIIHAAVSCHHLPYSFAEKLIDTYRAGLLDNNNAGKRNPLHRLCQRPVDVHQVLYSHFAKRENAVIQNDISLVALCTNSCPKAALQVDAQGKYALHNACKSGLTWSTGIGALVNAAPHVVALMDNCGQVPFVACAMAHAKRQEQHRSLLGNGGPDKRLIRYVRRGLKKKKKHRQSSGVVMPLEKPLTPLQEEALDLEVLDTLYGLLRHDPHVLKTISFVEIVL